MEIAVKLTIASDRGSSYDCARLTIASVTLSVDSPLASNSSPTRRARSMARYVSGAPGSSSARSIRLSSRRAAARSSNRPQAVRAFDRRVRSTNVSIVLCSTPPFFDSVRTAGAMTRPRAAGMAKMDGRSRVMALLRGRDMSSIRAAWAAPRRGDFRSLETREKTATGRMVPSVAVTALSQRGIRLS